MDTKTIWNDFSSALHRFIVSKVKEETIADDILQEVFIKIHLKKHLLQKEVKLKSWLFTIANNSINDYFRKHKTASQEIIPISESDDTEAHSAKDCLLPLILNLPKNYKEALLLSEIKGLKQKEVAENLKNQFTRC
jgi:RNA polymerase sigma-70 factor (ECF subfamily)